MHDVIRLDSYTRCSYSIAVRVLMLFSSSHRTYIGMSRTSDCSSLNKSSDLDLSRNSSSNASNLGSSPAGRSRSFSITDILSDEVGSRKRSPPDADTSGSKFPRTEHIRTSPGHHGNLLSLPMRQSGGIAMATGSSGMPRIPLSAVSPTQTPLFPHGKEIIEISYYCRDVMVL